MLRHPFHENVCNYPFHENVCNYQPIFHVTCVTKCYQGSDQCCPAVLSGFGTSLPGIMLGNINEKSFRPRPQSEM